MNSSEDELAEALHRHFDGTSTPEDQQRLSAALIADAAATDALVRAANLEVMFDRLHSRDNVNAKASQLLATLQLPGRDAIALTPTSPPIPDFSSSFESPLPNDAASERGGWNWRSSVFFLGGVFFACIVFGAWQNFRLHQDPRPIASLVSDRSIGYLAVANGCNWGRLSAGLWNVGQSVGLGEEIALHEGIAEFRLSSGVSLSVEGPAVLVMASPTSLILQQGKLTAHIPWKVADFQILAGTSRLTAADAEFGVQAKGNSVNIHVFSGEVTAILSPYAIKDFAAESDDDFVGDEAFKPTSIKIEQSQAVELTADVDGKTAVKNSAADPSQFASRTAMAGRLPITSRYVDAVKKSGPVAYWRFEGVENQLIRNEIATGCPLQATGDLTLPGDESNRVLELGGGIPVDKNSLASTAAMDSIFNGDFSVELWIKPSHYHWGILVSVMDKSYPPSNSDKEEYQRQNLLCGYGYRLQLMPDFGRMPGTLNSVVIDPPRQTPAEMCYTEHNLYRIRQWQHVVAVRGKWGTQIYLDGRRVASAPSRRKATLAEGQPLVVGRLQSFVPEISFIGQLDELAIYDKLLSPVEILEHYETVNKQVGSKQSDHNEASRAAVTQDS